MAWDGTYRLAPRAKRSQSCANAARANTRTAPQTGNSLIVPALDVANLSENRTNSISSMVVNTPTSAAHGTIRTTGNSSAKPGRARYTRERSYMSKYYIEYTIPPYPQVLNTTIEAESLDQAIASFRKDTGVNSEIRIINVSLISNT